MSGANKVLGQVPTDALLRLPSPASEQRRHEARTGCIGTHRSTSICIRDFGVRGRSDGCEAYNQRLTDQLPVETESKETIDGVIDTSELSAQQSVGLTTRTLNVHLSYYPETVGKLS